MANITTQPDNTNFLSPLGFRFILNRAPNVSYFCTSVSLPSINIAAIDQQNVFVQLPWAGDKVIYDPLSVRFKVDEDMANYMEIFNWIIALGHPIDFNQTKQLMDDLQPYLQSDMMSDGTLLIESNHRNTNIEVRFVDMFPVTLTPIEFDVSGTTVEPLLIDMSFRYRNFTVHT